MADEATVKMLAENGQIATQYVDLNGNPSADITYNAVSYTHLMLHDMPVTVIGIEKGRNTKERVERNFGQAHPEPANFIYCQQNIQYFQF